MFKGYTIDVETADKITIDVLKDHRDHLQAELDNHLSRGTWMHEDDVKMNKKLVKKMTFLLTRYFGVEE